MDKLLWMKCFVRVVETGSFSAVAREMNIGQPNVSRHIASLEKELDTRLFYRSTRQVVPTQEGQHYYAQARQALDLIAQAESEARGQHKPHGLLRLACSPALAAEKIVGVLPDFMARYPDVDLDLRLSDSYIDLVAEGVDIAIRAGVLKDSALRARRIGSSERVFVASAGYLERHGAPGAPADLLQHQCILYTAISGAVADWPFKDEQMQVTGRVRMNSLEGIRAAVLADMGIAYLPSWMVAEQLRSGAVRALLKDHAGPLTPINAVYAADRLLPQRAVVFIDYMEAVFAAAPGLNGVTIA